MNFSVAAETNQRDNNFWGDWRLEVRHVCTCCASFGASRTPALNHGRTVMASGKVKWFDNRRGFGFISQEQGQDVFVHHTSILGSGYKTLHEGELVNYELVNSDKGPKAQNVQRART